MTDRFTDSEARMADAPPTIPWHREAGLPAWLLSLVLHASLLVACGLLAPASQHAADLEPMRVVGIALVARESAPSQPYYSEGTSGSHPAAAAEPSPATLGLPSALDLHQSAGIELPQAGPGATAAGSAIGIANAAGLAAGGSGVGDSVPRGQTRTQVFGAQGEGSSFVYVFDRSSSMGGFGGRPLAAAKSQLQQSLQDLRDGNQFRIVFYNEQPAIFNPFRPNPPKMFLATDENKQLARDYVQSISPAGGTAHVAALEFALRMGPDVIFFLTDAGEPSLSPRELADLKRKNRTESVIHTIEFGSGPFPGGQNFLVRLAQQNRGQHVYVDVTGLPSER